MEDREEIAGSDVRVGRVLGREKFLTRLSRKKIRKNFSGIKKKSLR
jgi:hypothetical protein